MVSKRKAACISISSSDDSSSDDDVTISISDDDHNTPDDDGHITPDDDGHITPDDDHITESDDYVSDDDSFEALKNEITVRGPGYHGGQYSFDKVCIFGNLVEMNFNQMMHLRTQVENYPAQPIKGYVYTMTYSSVVKGKAKMEFSKDFSSGYLLGYLCAPVQVVVNCTTSKKTHYVRLMAGKYGKAVMTSGWAATATEFDLNSGDICHFSFRDERGSKYRDPSCWLRLVIIKLAKDFLVDKDFK